LVVGVDFGTTYSGQACSIRVGRLLTVPGSPRYTAARRTTSKSSRRKIRPPPKKNLRPRSQPAAGPVATVLRRTRCRRRSAT
jgi:hypothetical protein